ncbi:hypothetical protein OSJ77_19855 [Phyllobacterium sp. 0TCS1.6C]|uniref:hypothetical protein n=1 Tax=unclassified Phyllobacterium TaxID=2638441 RepID=UPI002263E2D5|nr:MULTISPECIES: hypothetical protein [unclassified Phyllobacterium]MCX8282449.1 hypothetical protein [Phyllobacterium sp. 0TCS1.6C]MCX8292541.1 hypothetical protein [Phyllobacterium sp. 0TCS1.6A]
MDPVRLIVVMAFDRSDEGDLIPAGEPTQFDSEDRALRTARDLAAKHESVIAWSRDAQPDVGEYGLPTVLFQQGEVPDME